MKVKKAIKKKVMIKNKKDLYKYRFFLYTNSSGDKMELLILCIRIFFIRIVDVSLGTIRTVLTVKDKNLKAALVGFIEVTIWFLVVKDALNSDIDSLWIAVSYAGGFATGTFIGGYLASFFTKGTVSIQLIIEKENEKLINILHDQGYAVSVINIKGYNDKDKLMLFSEVDMTKFNVFKRIVNEYTNGAFMVVNDTKAVYNGYFGGVIK